MDTVTKEFKGKIEMENKRNVAQNNHQWLSIWKDEIKNWRRNNKRKMRFRAGTKWLDAAKDAYEKGAGMDEKKRFKTTTKWLEITTRL